MAQHDQVCVGRDHADCVLERLPLDGAREGSRRLGPDHGSAEAQHRRLEAQARAGAGLVEERRHHPMPEPVVAHIGKRGGSEEEVVKQLAIELLGRDDVAEHPLWRGGCRHGASPSGPDVVRARAAAQRRRNPLPASPDLLEVDAFRGLYLRVSLWQSVTLGSCS